MIILICIVSGFCSKLLKAIHRVHFQIENDFKGLLLIKISIFNVLFHIVKLIWNFVHSDVEIIVFKMSRIQFCQLLTT